MPTITKYMLWSKEQSLTSQNRWFDSVETTRRAEKKIKLHSSTEKFPLPAN